MNLYLLYVRIEWQKCVSFFDLTHTFQTMCQVNRCTISSSHFFLYLKWSFDKSGTKNNNPKNNAKGVRFSESNIVFDLFWFGFIYFARLFFPFGWWRYDDILHYQHCIFLSLMRWWTFEQTRTLGKFIAFKSHALLHALLFYFLFKSNFLFNTK